MTLAFGEPTSRRIVLSQSREPTLEIQADGHVDPEQLEGLFSSGRVDTVVCALDRYLGAPHGKARHRPNRSRASSRRAAARVATTCSPSTWTWIRSRDSPSPTGIAASRISRWCPTGRHCASCPGSTARRSCCATRCSPAATYRSRCLLARSSNVRSSAPGARGLSVFCGSEVEVFFFRENYRDAWQQVYRDLHPMSYYRTDYHLLQTTKDEWLISQIRNGMEGARVPIESSKGEWGLGQHEINLVYRGRTRDGGPPCDLQARHQGDSGARRSVRHLHGQVVRTGGRVVVPHPLEPLGRRRHRATQCRCFAPGERLSKPSGTTSPA